MSNDRRWGEMLVKEGLITEHQLEAALSDQRSWGAKLGRSLVRIGAITREQLLDYLSKKFNVPKLDFRKSTVTVDALRLVPRDICWKSKMIPVAAKIKGNKKGLLLAMSDPSDIGSIQEVEFLTGYHVKVALADEEEIEKLIDYCYSTIGLRQCVDGEVLDDMINIRPEAIDMQNHAPVVFAEGGEEKILYQDNRLVAFRGLRALVDLMIDKGLITQEEYRKKLAEEE